MSREQTKQDLSPDENYEYSEQQKKIIFEEIRCLREMMEGFDDGYGDSDEYILQSFGDWSNIGFIIISYLI
jgi:hypothetical protein